MTDEQRVRLLNRITNCDKQIEALEHLLNEAGAKLKFWKNERTAAQSELIGMQLALSLRCTTCGD